MNFHPKDAADTCKADLGVTWEEVANRFNGRLRNVSGNCVTWCVFSPIPCATVPWSTLITKVRGALVKGTGTHTAKFLRLRCCCEFSLRPMVQGCPANKISRRVSGPGGSFRCWQAGLLLHLVTKQNIPEEVGEWGLSIQRWLSGSRKSWCRQLRCGKLATRQSSILCTTIHQGKSRRGVDGKVRTPSERQLPSWSDCPSWNTFLRLISDSIKKRFWEDCTATNTNAEGVFVMNGALKFKRVQSSRWQANHTSKISKMYWEGKYYYLKAEKSFIFAKILQSNQLRPLTTASMTKTGGSSYKLTTRFVSHVSWFDNVSINLHSISFDISVTQEWGSR